jgi:hypothetical protein
MQDSFLTIDFEASEKIHFSLGVVDHENESIPNWAKFANMPCPGNIEHGPKINYCRLGVEIQKLVMYFSRIKSIEVGNLTVHYDNSTETQFSSDAQTIFYNSIWMTLLHSNCSVFKYGQWARSNYQPSSEPERVFYTLFSIYLIEDFFLNPNTSPNIDLFKKQMLMLNKVLNNIIDRLRGNVELESDAVCNGLVLFSNLVLLLEMDFEELFVVLKEKINKDVRLEKWV